MHSIHTSPLTSARLRKQETSSNRTPGGVCLPENETKHLEKPINSSKLNVLLPKQPIISTKLRCSYRVGFQRLRTIARASDSTLGVATLDSSVAVFGALFADCIVVVVCIMQFCNQFPLIRHRGTVCRSNPQSANECNLSMHKKILALHLHKNIIA